VFYREQTRRDAPRRDLCHARRTNFRLRNTWRNKRLRLRFAGRVTEPAKEEGASITCHYSFIVEDVDCCRPISHAAGGFAD